MYICTQRLKTKGWLSWLSVSLYCWNDHHYTSHHRSNLQMHCTIVIRFNSKPTGMTWADQIFGYKKLSWQGTWYLNHNRSRSRRTSSVPDLNYLRVKVYSASPLVS